jgi:hypothetical protein
MLARSLVFFFSVCGVAMFPPFFIFQTKTDASQNGSIFKNLQGLKNLL